MSILPNIRWEEAHNKSLMLVPAGKLAAGDLQKQLFWGMEGDSLLTHWTRRSR